MDINKKCEICDQTDCHHKMCSYCKTEKDFIKLGCNICIVHRAPSLPYRSKLRAIGEIMNGNFGLK